MSVESGAWFTISSKTNKIGGERFYQFIENQSVKFEILKNKKNFK
jgi:hypothetical protein